MHTHDHHLGLVVYNDLEGTVQTNVTVTSYLPVDCAGDLGLTLVNAVMMFALCLLQTCSGSVTRSI